jgi:hypothetical protein
VYGDGPAKAAFDGLPPAVGTSLVQQAQRQIKLKSEKRATIELLRSMGEDTAVLEAEIAALQFGHQVSALHPPAAAAAPAPAPARAASGGGESLDALLGLGFDRAAAAAVLARFQGSLERAADFLLSGQRC